MSRKRTLSAPDVSYEFEHHNQGLYGPLHVAVNVKHHGSPKLTGKHIDMLDVLRKENPKIEDQLRDRAWSDTQENWWEWAADLAKSKALGEIHSAGRTGGWLTLDDWTLNRIEELIEYELEYRCKHCDQTLDEHVDAQCLFGPTQYAPVECLNRSTRERIDEVVAYCDEIRDSVAGIGETLQYNLEQQIEDAYVIATAPAIIYVPKEDLPDA